MVLDASDVASTSTSIRCPSATVQPVAGIGIVCGASSGDDHQLVWQAVFASFGSDPATRSHRPGSASAFVSYL